MLDDRGRRILDHTIVWSNKYMKFKYTVAAIAGSHETQDKIANFIRSNIDNIELYGSSMFLVGLSEYLLIPIYGENFVLGKTNYLCEDYRIWFGLKYDEDLTMFNLTGIEYNHWNE